MQGLYWSVLNPSVLYMYVLATTGSIRHFCGDLLLVDAYSMC